MLMHTLPNGDEVLRNDRTIIIKTHGCRKTLSTCAPNGGLHTGLKYIFNFTSQTPDEPCRMLAPTMDKHMEKEAERIGLDPAECTGLITAALMENAAICEMTYADVTVTAIVTAGIDHNGGRVGDTAVWHEKLGRSRLIRNGTVNTLLYISANLPDEAITRSLITATEAKTAALQELAAPSCYSSGLATGSGTDGTVIICDTESPVLLTLPNKHYKLGELIGRTVMTATKESLCKQSGLCPERQHDVFRRLGRFGLTQESIADRLPQGCTADDLHAVATDDRMATAAALCAHLLDELSWQLLSPDEAAAAAADILRQFNHTPTRPLCDAPAMVAAWQEILLSAFSAD